MKDILDGIKSKTKQAIKNPGAKFGALYIYILLVGLAIGIYYVNNLENISRQKVPPILPDTTVVTDLAVKYATNVPPVMINEVSKSTPELIAEGEKLYKTNCASCHGENGTGGGPASMGLNPAPRNFTSKDNWKNGTKISEIYTTLQEGLLPSAMIAYEFLLPQQKFALAHYLRATFIPTPDSDTDADLQALDATYNLSAGLTLAAQIPVKSASFLVISENQTANNKIDSTLSSLNKYQSEIGFNTFSKVVKNKKVALSFLSKNSVWKK
ncbi:MAG: cytochrome c, partial [Ignavibacteria bacterium]|nr:cytochrome c [Ignavibacteria bacterium]